MLSCSWPVVGNFGTVVSYVSVSDGKLVLRNRDCKQIASRPVVLKEERKQYKATEIEQTVLD